MFDDCQKYVLGPLSVDVTKTSRVIEVCDTVLIEGKGTLFGHQGIMKDGKRRKCCYKVASRKGAVVYRIDVEQYMDLASDRELKQLMEHNR